MDERYHSLQGLQQHRPLRIRHKSPYQVPQTQRLIAPRERYRATQYHHPMCDSVEDDACGESARLDTFVEKTHQRPYNDRQYHTGQDRARLSLFPASFRLYDGESIERERSQPHMQYVHQEAFDARVLTSPGRFAYNANNSLDSSSDAPLGVPSSPALNAGRRRADYCETNLPLQTYEPQPFEDVSPEILIKHEEDAQRLGVTDVSLSRKPQRNMDRPFQPRAEERPNQASSNQPHALPTVQGIPLVPVAALPDRIRTVFPFPMFNAVQSKCFARVFKSDDNFVLSSPTGSGKTAILELAICRAIATNSTDQYKVIYQAPTKALCSERQRDWNKKFTQIGLNCVELTGDSNATDLRNVQSANIIITTPEKWDSITRKWKDHERLMGLIKLFLIDEVHILNDNRGAVLEAVVSRMKSISTEVRFVALSATVPNFHDVATWLGKSSAEPYVPAPDERFGENFRPVKLRKHVCGYVCNSNNDFAFDKQLDARLPEIFTNYSERKPIMIFCATRKSCASTAAFIANWWATREERDHIWRPPPEAPRVQDKHLREVIASGVAFHHGGLDPDDRLSVENGYLQGDISVICCTSTLAVGVNLPCHLVIIKNTVSWSQIGLQEYSDIEMMQMLGRAGRPQFDDSAVAVIMTRQSKVRRYENLVTGEEILESKLHLNLIEHMNAEIGLGTIRDIDSARKWLTGTFLYVRLRQNPAYYKFEGSRNGQDIQRQIDDICSRDIAILKEYHLAAGDEPLRCTEFGHAMARYYVQFETMKVFMGLQFKSTLSEILSAIAQAAEFSKIRFRPGEKSLYKKLNRSPSIRFPIPVNLDLPAQKVSLIIQSVLGHADICWDGDASKHKQQYALEVATIFRSINSLIRCIIDCQIYLGDSASIHSALMLERGLGSKAWDDSPLQMIQVPEIGAVAVRKLVNAGIRSLEDLAATDARRIETIVGRNPPFGLKILACLRSYPKLRISLHIQPSSAARTSEGVRVHIKADIGFLNETPPDKFASKLIYVCVLAETSDGRKIYFARINGPKLGAGQSLVFPVLLTSADQCVNCYLMCEGIAGSMRNATVTPRVSPALFLPQVIRAKESAETHEPNISRRRVEDVPVHRKKSTASDEFGDADIDDETLVNAGGGGLEFEHIDDFTESTNPINRGVYTKRLSIKEKGPTKCYVAVAEDAGDSAPHQLPNGRWICNHKCKNKEACKHYCCKHGMDRPPKKAVPKSGPIENPQPRSLFKSSGQQNVKTQTKLQLTHSKRNAPATIDELDLTQQVKKRKKEHAFGGSHDYRDLHNLHKSVQKDMPQSLHSVMHTKPAYHYGQGEGHQLSFLTQTTLARSQTSSDYGDFEFDELANESSAAQGRREISGEMASLHVAEKAPVTSRGPGTSGDDGLMFGEAMVGLAGFQDLQRDEIMSTSSMQNHKTQDVAQALGKFSDMSFLTELDFAVTEGSSHILSKGTLGASACEDRQTALREAHGPFIEATSSPEQSCHFASAVSKSQGKEDQDGQEIEVSSQQSASTPRKGDERSDIYQDLLELLGEQLPTNKENITAKQRLIVSKSMTKVTEVPKEGTMDIPENFQNLQPWLLQEFGDIVELVDE
ncbi:Pre-mRNA-splicing factor brr2 [Stagonosporopsis vannaccii]|nr:Pre-mRNA-splicing factor brr2 [Stagonosporopsis vannaccii]